MFSKGKYICYTTNGCSNCPSWEHFYPLPPRDELLSYKDFQNRIVTNISCAFFISKNSQLSNLSYILLSIAINKVEIHIKGYVSVQATYKLQLSIPSYQSSTFSWGYVFLDIWSYTSENIEFPLTMKFYKYWQIQISANLKTMLTSFAQYNDLKPRKQVPLA